MPLPCHPVALLAFAMGDISLFRAELTSLLIESLLFGCFCVLYLVSLWTLAFRRRSHGPSDSIGKCFLVMVTVMLVLSMTHLVIIGENIIWSFSDYNGPGGVSAALLSPRRDTSLIASMAITAVLTLAVDNFMVRSTPSAPRSADCKPIRPQTQVYRIFVVWDRAWLPIVLPSVCMFGTVAGAAACAYEFYHARLGITQAMYSEQRMYVALATFLACSLAANLVISTGAPRRAHPVI
ncbi:hypothetical protein BD413DRAFT_194384 [Trametes elegans]|nr:hypothetical protein BD413DRAFT_194384 [Trametes elegans]